jgi:DNA-directed RNA polymerase subunit omega
MARITVEDCLEKIDSQYDLVLLAKERTAQLNAGDLPLVSKDDDKNTVISLREIGEGKVTVKSLEESAINKLRKPQIQTAETEELEEDEHEDNFDKIYRGEISKSGSAILPSKRTRRMPDKLNFEKKNLEALKENAQEDSAEVKEEDNNQTKEADIKPE